MSPKILVTGCLGHIGSALVRAWPGAWFTGLDDLSAQRYAALWAEPRPPRFVFVEGDIRAPALNGLLADRGIDAVVHLAALTDAAGSVGREHEYYAVNAAGTQAVAEACLLANVPLVVASTTSVYGPQPAGRGQVDEALHPDQYNPQSPYASSKLAAEELLRRHFGPRGLRYTVLRFGTIYGPSPGMRFHTAVNRFCWQACLGQTLTVWAGAWDARRPYCALGTAVAALRAAVEAWPCGGETHNVVTGHHTVREVVESIRRWVPDVAVEEVPAPLLNQEGYRVRSRWALRDRGLPPGSLDAGIRETVRLLRPDLYTAALRGDLDAPAAAAAAAA